MPKLAAQFPNSTTQHTGHPFLRIPNLASKSDLYFEGNLQEEGHCDTEHYSLDKGIVFEWFLLKTSMIH
jgi:hypothetical protein